MFNYLEMSRNRRTWLCALLRREGISYKYKNKKLNNTDRLYRVADVKEKHIKEAIKTIKNKPDYGYAKRKSGLVKMDLRQLKKVQIKELGELL